MNDANRGDAPNMDAITKLNRLAAAYAPHDGLFELPVPGLSVFRSSRPDPHPTSVMSPAGVCIVTQGAKRVILGDEMYEYDRTKMIVYAMALPVEARVVQASRAEPYYCVTLDIPLQKISELSLKVFPHGLPKSPDLRTIHLGHTDEDIVSAVARLMELMKTPKEMGLLHGVITEEIFIRLLCGPFGPAVARVGEIESSTAKIHRAISWLRDNYAETLDIGALAELANMSESSFHRHFKSVTKMSPGQFQRTLRMQEAKSLMLTEMMDVTGAGQRVGYVSPSQFSREYSRFFGSPPSKDVTKARRHESA